MAGRRKTKLTKREQSAAVNKIIQAVQGAKFYGKVELSFWAGNLEMFNLNQSILPDEVFAERSVMIVTLTTGAGHERPSADQTHEEGESDQIPTSQSA